MEKKKLTTASGRPYFENEDSMTVTKMMTTFILNRECYLEK